MTWSDDKEVERLNGVVADLLAALEGLLEDHERICEAHNKYPGPTRCGDAQRARAALAAAHQGESEPRNPWGGLNVPNRPAAAHQGEGAQENPFLSARRDLRGEE